MVRFFIAGRGEVCWEEMAKWLDKRQAAMYGSNAWVLLPRMDIADLRQVALFLDSTSASSPLTDDSEEENRTSQQVRS